MTSSEEVLFDNTARRHIAHGLIGQVNAIKGALGPSPRYVLLQGAPNDLVGERIDSGSSASDERRLERHFVNLGVQMAQLVAAKTRTSVGDGTVTASLLAQSIFGEGAALVSGGANAADLVLGIDAAVQAVATDLRRQSKQDLGRADLVQVATTSAQGEDGLGERVAEAVARVGSHNVVAFEQTQSPQTTLEFVAGMQLDRGYLSQYFVTDTQRQEAVLHDAYVLMDARTAPDLANLLPMLELIALSKRPLLVIGDLGPSMVSALVANKLRGRLAVCVVESPGVARHRQEMCADIAALTGGRVITDATDCKLENLTSGCLGHARTVIVGEDTTVLIGAGGSSPAIQTRLRQLREQLATVFSAHDRVRLDERIAKLVDGVAVIGVGGRTRSERTEKRRRVEGAVCATAAAAEEGVVAGGGVALLRSLPALANLELPAAQQLGINLVKHALEQPLRQLARNSGVSGRTVVTAVSEGVGGFGYDVVSARYWDLFEAGVVDAAKVVRLALQNAASTASLGLTTTSRAAGPTITGRSGKPMNSTETSTDSTPSGR